MIERTATSQRRGRKIGKKETLSFRLAPIKNVKKTDMLNYKQLNIEFERLARGNRPRQAMPIDEVVEKQRQLNIINWLIHKEKK